MVCYKLLGKDDGDGSGGGGGGGDGDDGNSLLKFQCALF